MLYAAVTGDPYMWPTLQARDPAVFVKKFSTAAAGQIVVPARTGQKFYVMQYQLYCVDALTITLMANVGGTVRYMNVPHKVGATVTTTPNNFSPACPGDDGGNVGVIASGAGTFHIRISGYYARAN